MNKLVLFGNAAFAEIAHYYFSTDSPYDVVGFTVDRPYLNDAILQGLPVVPFDEVERHFPPDQHELFVAVGYHDLNRQRADKMAAARARGYVLASFVASTARVPDDFVAAPNTMIQEHSVIQPFVTIGEGTIVWSTTRIGFHSSIGDLCWIVCPIMGESVVVGNRSFIGLNATIGPSIEIGKANVIGAGSLVLRSTGDEEVYRGERSKPAKVKSTRLRF